MDTLPSTFYHSEAVKSFNKHAYEQNNIALPFDEAELIATARQQTGLERFGDEEFIPNLRVLINSLNSEANLNPFGKFIVRASILEPLKNRLWANACFEAYPEILEQEIEKPICIIGPHRSGTTRMHRMLASDLRLQHLPTWVGMNPAPRLKLPKYGAEQRYKEIEEGLGGMQACYQEAFIGHPMHPDWPEEEMLLMNMSFLSFSFLGNSYIPSFYRHYLEADKNAAYAYLVKMLKLISWARNDPPNKRWVLKNPAHMLDLTALKKALPDIKMVFPHRDPLKTVGSVISLMWLFGRQNTDMPLRGPMREIWWDYCQQAARRSIEARENLPADQQLDVYYEDINKNWRGVMRKVYEFSELEFTHDAENALANWLNDSEKDSLHVGHKYSLEDFGLTTNQVEEGMKFVRAKYNIPRESKP